MRFAIGKAIILGAAVAATSLVACSSKDRTGAAKENIGDLGLQLQVGGLTVNSVHYVLTNGTNTYSGDLDVSGSSTLNATIGGIAAGSGYNLTLTATADTTPCAGSAGPFTVTANATVSVMIELSCVRPRVTGSVVIDGRTNLCPDITSVIGDPARGCSIGLHVAATDDGIPQPLSYTWSNGLSGANPIYTCTSGGSQTFTVTVSDGDTVAGCAHTFSVTIVCPSTCSAGGTGAGGAGGMGGAGGSAVEAGPGGAGGAGGSAVEAGPGGAGGAGGSAGAVDAGRDAEAGPPPPPTTPGILSTLNPGHSADCLACAQAIAVGTNCELPLLNCETFTGAQYTSCINTLLCVVPSSCVGEAFSDLAPCYCGTAIGTGCLTPGAANGVCRTVIETGLASTDPSFISGNLTNQTFGTGRAMQLMQCLADFGCQSCF